MRQQPTRVDRRKGGRCMPSSEAGPQHPFYLTRKKSLRVHCESGIWIQPISKPIHCDGTLDF